jgi:hypothetical protein
MNDRNEQLTIGALARRAGVTVETIRFYQRRGLLAEPDLPRLEGVLSGLVDACTQDGACGCPLIKALRGPRPVAVCKVSPT